jgi:hypothetical protein
MDIWSNDGQMLVWIYFLSFSPIFEIHHERIHHREYASLSESASEMIAVQEQLRQTVAAKKTGHYYSPLDGFYFVYQCRCRRSVYLHHATNGSVSHTSYGGMLIYLSYHLPSSSSRSQIGLFSPPPHLRFASPERQAIR